MTNKTILIVEDEFLIAKDIGDILEEEGYTIINYISCYDDAIEIIERKSPDLVITDISLRRDKDGVDIGRYLLEKDRIPFIYISSHTDRLMMNRVNETRPHAFIVKPFKPQDVKTTVSLVLNNYVYRNIDVLRSQKEPLDDVPFIFKKVIHFINENLDKPIRISDLANLTKWKKQHFQRMFVSYLGTTPNQYILMRRIEKGKCLLAETDLTIAEISFDLGFKSTSNFFMFFKKITGKTPDAYRKWHKTIKEISG